MRKRAKGILTKLKKFLFTNHKLRVTNHGLSETSQQALSDLDLVALLITDFAHQGQVDAQFFGYDVCVLAGEAAFFYPLGDQFSQLGVVHNISS